MCGIFATRGPNAAGLTVLGLHAIQHRAISYAGIVSCDGRNFYSHYGSGVARQIFSSADSLCKLRGQETIGHIRYPTVWDDPNCVNIQPITGNYGGCNIALAHNGNVTNVDTLLRMLGDIPRATSMDSELILRLIEQRHTGDIIADLCSILPEIRGSYALCIMLPGMLLAIRDPSGNRPLSVGLANGDGKRYFVSSETCAFPIVGAHHALDVEPGTIVRITDTGIESFRFAEPHERLCRFEAVYFGSPASVIFGERIARFRQDIGKALGTLYPVPDADIITAIPDSANFMARGFGLSNGAGELFPVIMRNHYVGRTFTAATQANRNAEVARKFLFNAEEIRDRVIVVLDDSIVRGTTLPVIVSMLRELKARAVHVRIGSPPMMFPCRYGINTPTSEELIAADHSADWICERVKADSLEYLPLEILQKISPHPDRFCFACMNGQYWD